jgi:hypothetical protein
MGETEMLSLIYSSIVSSCSVHQELEERAARNEKRCMEME